MSPKTVRAKASYVLPNPKAKLLDQMREVLRVNRYAIRTEQAYVDWVTRFLKFHREPSGAWRHPRELGAGEIGAFLSHLANENHVAASTQNQALNALVFLYDDVLHVDIGDFGQFTRAKRSARIPVVLSREQVARLLAAMTALSS